MTQQRQNKTAGAGWQNALASRMRLLQTAQAELAEAAAAAAVCSHRIDNHSGKARAAAVQQIQSCARQELVIFLTWQCLHKLSLVQKMTLTQRHEKRHMICSVGARVSPQAALQLSGLSPMSSHQTGLMDVILPANFDSPSPGIPSLLAAAHVSAS